MNKRSQKRKTNLVFKNFLHKLHTCICSLEPKTLASCLDSFPSAVACEIYNQDIHSFGEIYDNMEDECHFSWYDSILYHCMGNT